VFPKANPTRSKAYRDFVKSLPCCGCGCPADDPHHIIDAGLGGTMGGNASDIHVLPMCRQCHTLLHKDVQEWELNHGDQCWHIIRTQIKAEAAGLFEGVKC